MPIFCIAIISCTLVVPNTRQVSAHDGAAQPMNFFVRIDIAGILLLGLSILVLMLPLELGGVKIPWHHPAVFVLFGAGALLFLLFLANEIWWAKNPAFPVRMLKNRELMACYAVIGLLSAAQTAVSGTPSLTGSLANPSDHSPARILCSAVFSSNPAGLQHNCGCPSFPGGTRKCDRWFGCWKDYQTVRSYPYPSCVEHILTRFPNQHWTIQARLRGSLSCWFHWVHPADSALVGTHKLVGIDVYPIWVSPRTA